MSEPKVRKLEVPNQAEIVEYAESILETAKSGNCTGLVAITTANDSESTVYKTSGLSDQVVLGRLFTLMHKIASLGWHSDD